MPRNTTASLTLLLACASGLALAASAGPEKHEKPDKDTLKGPTVVTTSDAAPKRDKDATDPGAMETHQARDAEKDRPIALREYQGAIRMLSNPNAETSLNLSQEQKDQIRAIMDDHRAAMQAFTQEHRDQIQEMRERMRAQVQKAGENAKDADSKEKSGTDADDAQRKDRDDRAMRMREKLRRFIDNAPPNKEAIDRINRVLSEDQQAVLQEKIVQIRERLAQRDRAPGAQHPGEMSDDENATDERPDRSRVRRQRMNPEQVRRSDDKKDESDRPNRKKQGDDPDDD